MRLFHKLALAIVLMSLLAMLFPISVVTAADEVYFPDPVLREAIRGAIGGGDITQVKLDLLTNFAYDNWWTPDIQDITGIEHCTSLTSLGLSRNQISDISPLTGLTNLKSLMLDSNQISDISPLSGLTNLTYLWLNRNQISDISTLSGLTNLTSLGLDRNQISDISTLSGLTNLTFLGLGESNQISDISPLSGLTNLTYLWLIGDQISDISPVSGLTNLTSLGLSRNQISDISTLSGLTDLTWLFLGLNQISDISPLSGLTNLTSLGLSRNQISDISTLSGLTNLRRLDLDRNQISDISTLSGLTNLTWLLLGSNQISDISTLSGLTNLETLWLDRNQISDISTLSGLTNLTSLGLNNNQISNISPLSGLTNLTSLSLGSSQISDISTLSGLTNLRQLYLDRNQISDISPLSGLTNLIELDLSFNQISDIEPLINNPGLSMVNLWNNPLNSTSVDTYIPQLQARLLMVHYALPNTPTGSNVLVGFYNGAVIVTFAEVTVAGSTGITPFVGSPYDNSWYNWSSIPPGVWPIGDVGDFATTATYIGPITIDCSYDESMVTNESSLTVFYWNGTKWVEANVGVDTVNNRIHQQLPFLAPGFLAERAGREIPTVTTNPATNVFANSVILRGYLDSKGNTSSVDVCFEWATDAYYNSHGNTYDQETSPLWPMTSTGAFSYSLTGLSPHATYHFRAKAAGDGTSYGNDTSFTTAEAGIDGDGVPANIEDAAPNNGDANYDGTPDSQQDEVASLPNAVNGEYATIESPSGTSLTNVAVVSVNSLPSEGKPNLVFPYGLFYFHVMAMQQGGTVWLTLRFENPVPAGSEYWKYGPTPDNHTPHWYQIPMRSNDGDNVIEIQLIDGGLGDDDLTANGVIVDQGGPGYPPAPTPTATPTATPGGGGTGGGGGGGGCFIATAAYGSSLDSHVDTLRSFRDQYLETNPIGSAFVSLYYKVSPPMADFIDEHPTLKPIVRAGLVPAVVMSTVAVDTTPVEKIAILGSLALVCIALAIWVRERARRLGRGR